MMTQTLQRLEVKASSSSDENAVKFDVLEEMRKCGIPKKFRRAESEWKTPDFVKPYMPPESRLMFRDFKGLFLTGNEGRKKSSTLCLLARDWMERYGKGEKVWSFVSFPDLCMELQESWGEGRGGPSTRINALSRVPILIIDDVGVEKTTDFVLQAAYLLFNKREQNELPTYGTSNFSIEVLSEKLDARIASRIKGMCHVVAVGGEDARAKA